MSVHLPLTHRPRRLLVCLIALVAVLAPLAAPAPSLAKEPCAKQLIDDWYADGRIDNVYPVHCYVEAKRNLPIDLRQYSTLPDDIDRALQGVVHKNDKGGSGKGDSGKSTGSNARAALPSSGNRSAIKPTNESGKSNGVFGRAIDWLGPDNAESIPLPLIVLAGVGLLLVLAGLGGYAARRIQARRMGVPISGPPAGPKP